MTDPKFQQTIAFLSNQALTASQKLLADRLEAFGYRCVWLVPGKRWDHWLAQNNVPADRRLPLYPLTEQSKSMSVETAKAVLAAWEQEDRPRMSSIIRMDRLMKHWPKDQSWRILATYGQAISRFLEEQNVIACFGEQSWAWEILTALIARQQGRACYFYHTVRIPSGRWGIFESITHRLIFWRTPTADDEAWAEAFLKEWRERPTKPFYAGANPPATQVRRHWWREMGLRLVPNAEATDDITVRPLHHAIPNRLHLAWNAFRLRLSPPFEPPPATGPFVLFCLHHSPEASLDVFGGPHADQAHLIQRLSSILPATHELWVKEHPDWLGDRSPAWFRRVKALPNVRLIDPAAPTLELVKRADLVVTVTGTVGYEAALLNRPAVALMPLFFSPLMQIPADRFPDPLTWRISDLLTPPTEAARSQHDGECHKFLARLHAVSFEGSPGYGSPDVTPEQLDPIPFDSAALNLSIFLKTVHPPSSFQ